MKNLSILFILFVLATLGCNKNVSETQSADDEKMSSIDKPMSAPDFEQKLPLEMGSINIPVPETRIPVEIPMEIPAFPVTVPDEFREFYNWVSTKLSYEEGRLRGIITAKYKGKKLRVALVYYGDRSWQYIYDPVIMNSDMKAIFGFWITGGIIENNDQAVEDNYPTFVVPEGQSRKFVKVVFRHMKMSKLLKNLKISWEAEEGAPITKPPVGC